MSDALTVAVAQIEPRRPAAESLKAVREAAAVAAGEGARLLVCPEGVMHEFGLPDVDLAAIAEPLDGPWATGLVGIAAEHDLLVVAGMWESTPSRDRARNVNIAVDGSGLVARYQKIHLFDSFGFRESDFVEPGEPEAVWFELDGFRIGLTTCYDVRFPEQYTHLAGQAVDAICVIAGWVAGPGKVGHWETLLRARAIETTSYVLAADLTAPRFAGHSGIWDPFGDQLAQADDGPTVIRAVLSRERVEEVRAMIPSLNHKRFAVAPAAVN